MSDSGERLRLRAEALLDATKPGPAGPLEAMAPEAVRQLLHELGVHQVELEMQNEELRRAQVELDRSRASYFDLYDLAPVAYLTLDERGLVLQANLTAATLLGLTRSALNKRLFTWLIVPEHRARWHQVNVRVSESGQVESCELRLQREDGTSFWGLLAMTLVPGSPERRVAMTDVTPRKEAEAALRAHEERSLAERTRLQASLAQRDRLATMGLLAAGIAHELNNPLTYTLSCVESLSEDLPRILDLARRCFVTRRQQEGEAGWAALAGDALELADPAGLDDLVDRAQIALEGMLRLVKISRGLGSFSRVDRGVLEGVDLNHVIEGAAAMAHNELKFRARLVTNFGPLPRVLASESKLAQVFLNLLINAAQAIGEGHVESNTVTVRTWAQGESVCAEISDTGPGIAPADLERIFEPFVTTRGPGGGAGLGLTICRSLVTEFGGSLRAESLPGQGARFVVTLPAQQTPVVAQPQPLASPGVARGRILVVDDEAAIRRVLTRLLDPAHEVVTAGSGAEAKALLETDRSFDVILCDLMMPNVTGMELHAWLAEREPALARRVIFISGGATMDSASAYLSSVPNLQVGKPFDRTALLELIGQQVAAARAGREDSRSC